MYRKGWLMDMLTMEDVWGKKEYISKGNYKVIVKGMVVADNGDICPIWGDEIPYKSATLICDESQVEDVNKWIRYVKGQGYSRIKKLENGKVALRSDYCVLCW